MTKTSKLRVVFYSLFACLLIGTFFILQASNVRAETINAYATDNWNGVFHLNKTNYATDYSNAYTADYSDNAIYPFVYYFVDGVYAKSLILMNYYSVSSAYSSQHSNNFIGYIGFMPCDNPAYLLDNYDEDKMNAFAESNATIFGVADDNGSQCGVIIDLEDKTYTGLLILSFVDDYFNENVTDDMSMWPIPFFTEIEINSLSDTQTDYLNRYNYDFGYSNGYDDGSNQGYDLGYEDGYQNALSISSNNLAKYNNVLVTAWNGASSFLNTKVFGDMTILHLILIPLTLGVLIIIIKLVRG